MPLLPNKLFNCWFKKQAHCIQQQQTLRSMPKLITLLSPSDFLLLPLVLKKCLSHPQASSFPICAVSSSDILVFCLHCQVLLEQKAVNRVAALDGKESCWALQSGEAVGDSQSEHSCKQLSLSKSTSHSWRPGNSCMIPLGTKGRANLAKIS